MGTVKKQYFDNSILRFIDETLCPFVVYFVLYRICKNVHVHLLLPTWPVTCLFCSPLVDIFLFAKNDQELKLTHPIFSLSLLGFDGG
jgi:hypothetical protein